MPAKSSRRSKKAPRRTAPKRSRENDVPDVDERVGAPLPLFPNLDPADVAKIEIYRMVKRIKGRAPEPVMLNVQFPLNGDRDDIREMAGGGHFILRAKDHSKNYLEDGACSVIIEGEARTVGSGYQQGPTANETSMGVITIPGVPPLVNLLFAQQQQLVAQARQDQADITEKIVRMFNAVCGSNAAVAAAGGGSDREMLGLVLKLLLKDSSDLRERLQSVAVENVELKEQRAKGKGKTNGKDLLLGAVDAIMQGGPPLVDAVGRAWRGELPAGEALKLAGNTVANAAQAAEAGAGADAATTAGEALAEAAE